MVGGALPKPTFHNLSPQKRQRIVDAAIDEFSTQPYARATLDRIVAAAGISKGSMYQYFEGKVDLYRWLLIEHTTERKLAAIGADAPEPGASVWEVLEAAFLAGARFAAAEPRLTLLGVRFLRDHELEPELDAISRQHKAAADAWMIALLQRAQRRGELRAELDLPTVAGLLSHALGEGMLDQIARRLDLSLAELLEQPQEVQALSQDDLAMLVRNVTRLFRDGAGARPEPSS